MAIWYWMQKSSLDEVLKEIKKSIAKLKFSMDSDQHRFKGFLAGLASGATKLIVGHPFGKPWNSSKLLKTRLKSGCKPIQVFRGLGIV